MRYKALILMRNLSTIEGTFNSVEDAILWVKNVIKFTPGIMSALLRDSQYPETDPFQLYPLCTK